MNGIERYDWFEDGMDTQFDGDYVSYTDHASEIARLRAELDNAAAAAVANMSLACEKEREADALRQGLEAVYQFGSDTLRGPTGDTPDDRKWHRTAVLEMTNCASRTIDTGSWKKHGDAAMGADA